MSVSIYGYQARDKCDLRYSKRELRCPESNRNEEFHIVRTALL